MRVPTPTGVESASHIVWKRAPAMRLKILVRDAVIPASEITLICAEEHLLGVPSISSECSWVYAKDLKRLDEIKHSQGVGVILSIEPIGTIDLYDIQVNAPHHSYYDANGVLHHNTLMVAGMVDVLGEDDIRSLVIVPSSDLVEQTSNTFKLCNIDHGLYSGDKKDLYHPHVIGTWQALQNNPRVIEDFQCVIVDECFAGDQLVMTSRGSVRIDAINVGDMVLSFQDDAFIFNKVQRVLIKQSSSPMLELTFDNGVSIKVTEDHEFFTKEGKVRARDLTKRHEIIHFTTKRDALSAAKVNRAMVDAQQKMRVVSVLAAPANGQKLISATLNNGRVLSAVEYKLLLARVGLAMTSIFDDLYSIDPHVSAAALRQYILTKNRNNGKKASGIPQKRSTPPWNKRVSTGHIPWNKGKTKHTNLSLAKISTARSGAGNPQFGKPISAEQAVKQSIAIRAAIAEGRFTPNVHNSRTINRQSTFDGKGFRSSWEALFWSCNQHLVFESGHHRKILSNGSVFIPDFVDSTSEIVYEVKPKSKFAGSKSELGLKEFSAIGWTTVVITEDILQLLYKICDRSKFDPDTLRRLDNSFGRSSCVS